MILAALILSVLAVVLSIWSLINSSENTTVSVLNKDPVFTETFYGRVPVYRTEYPTSQVVQKLADKAGIVHKSSTPGGLEVTK